MNGWLQTGQYTESLLRELTDDDAGDDDAEDDDAVDDNAADDDAADDPVTNENGIASSFGCPDCKDMSVLCLAEVTALDVSGVFANFSVVASKDVSWW